MKNFTKISLGFSLLVLSSCATIITGTNQKVMIDSYPQGARIIVDGKEEGITPAKVKLDKDVNLVIDGGRPIVLEKDGYTTEAYHLAVDFNAVAILNLFNPGCWAIDFITGAVVKYDDYQKFNLRPESPSVLLNENTTDRYQKLRALDKLLKDGIITQEEFEKEKKKILDQ